MIETNSPFICDAGDVTACRKQTQGATEEASYSEGMCMDCSTEKTTLYRVKTTFIFRVRNFCKTQIVMTTYIYRV